LDFLYLSELAEDLTSNKRYRGIWDGYLAA